MTQHPPLAVQSANWSFLTDRQTSKQCYAIHAYKQGKNKIKWSPSVLSDAEVPRPVSPLSAVPGRRPKRLWNFSDTAGVCHSMSANRADVHLWNGTMETEENINTRKTNTQYAFWLQSVHLPANLDSIYRCEVVIPYKIVSPDWEERKIHYHTVHTHWKDILRLCTFKACGQLDKIATGQILQMS